MATNYKIAAEFSVVDRGATAALNNMAGRAGVFSSMWNKSINAAQTRLEALGKTVAKASKYAVGGAVGAVSAGIVVATKQYADFDQAIRAAGAAYGPAFSQAADFEDKIKGMGAAVRAVAAATEFDATQSANALKTLALAGVQSEAAIKLLPGVADLATAAMVDMDTAAGIATDTLNKMGLVSSNPEIYAANLTRVSDVMTHTANSAKMSLQDAAAAIAKSGDRFLTVNNNLNVLSGGLTALAKSGLAGAEAGTAMRNIMQSLLNPTDKAQKMMTKLGIRTADAEGNLLPLPKIIGQLNKATAGLGDVKQSEIIGAIFNKFDVAAVSNLMRVGQGALEEYAAAAANSAGTVVANAEAMRGSLVNKFRVLLSALTELGFKFVDAFAVKGGGAIEAITKAVSEFDPTPLVSALSVAANAIIGVVKVAWALRYVIAAVAGAFVLWRTVTTGAAIALNAYNVVTGFARGIKIAYKAAVVGTTVAIKASTLATKAAIIGMKAYAVGAKIAAVATGIFNAVLNANPIVLIITAAVAAVIALIAVITKLVGGWQKVTAAVDGFFSRIRNMQGIGGAILRFLAAPLEMVWNMVRGVFDVFNAFSVGGFIAGIKMIGVALLQFLIAPVEALLQMLSVIPVIGDMFGGWNDRLHDWIEGMRADILGEDESSAEEEASDGVSMQPPTMPDFAAAQAAESMSREESVTTNRLEVSLAPELVVRPVARMAPAFTLYSGRRG